MKIMNAKPSVFQRWRYLSLVGGVVVLTFLVLPSIGQAAVRNRRTGVSFATINAAITAALPGDVLNVDPGNYPENVVVNQPVILNGLSTRTSRVVIVPAGGTPLMATVAGATINGLSIVVPAGQTGVMVTAPVNLQNCRINGGSTGIQTQAAATVTGNTVEGYDTTGILVNGPQAGTVTVNNNVVDGSASFNGIGIFAQGAESVQITNNTVRNHAGDGNIGGVGVNLFAVSSAAGSVSPVRGNRIEDNVIGLVVFAATNAEARDNVVQNSAAFKAAQNAAGYATIGEAISLAGTYSIYVSDTVRGFDDGIESLFLGTVIVNTSLVENNTSTFPNFGNGINFLGAGAGAVTNSDVLGNNIGINIVTGSTATVNNNNIQGNTGFGVFTDGTAGTIDAQYNWWGAADGPGPVGPGSGDNVSASVDFSNFLSAPLPRNAIGGRGDRGGGGGGGRP